MRLKIDDANGHSYGTGTIIDTHGQEALVLTCGHVFRDSQGKGAIQVTMFAAEAAQPVEGQLVHYDLQRDVGLISIRPGIKIKPIRVAPRAHRVRPGDSVFSVGCDHGDDASVRFSKVTAIDKYLGSPNIEVAGQPVDGRSGGGLFSAEGMLIGVCNAADPADDEGIYAALATVQQQLDEIGQTRIYEVAATASLTDSPMPMIETPDLLDQPSGPPPVGRRNRRREVRPRSCGRTLQAASIWRTRKSSSSFVHATTRQVAREWWCWRIFRWSCKTS